MSEPKHWLLRIRHILDAIEEIESFTAGLTREQFLTDIKTMRAVERDIEIIGEATTKIPQEIKTEYSEIPWNGMKGLRNAVSHGYAEIEYESIWDVIINKLPDLKRSLLALQSAETP